LYLDQGVEQARQFVLHIIEPALETTLAAAAEKDAKSRLQEVSQSYYQVTPTYRTVKEQGPDHAKEFTVEAVIDNKSYGQGKGFSKQTAAQAAAQQALEALAKEIAQANS
jgi:ribonuclease-3